MTAAQGARRRPPAKAPRTSWAARAWRGPLGSPSARIGCALVASHLAVALLAPAIAPHAPTAIDTAQAYAPPSWEHPFGTDQYGRDLLSRVLFGGRVALAISLSAAAVSVVVGSLIGVLVGYLGGIVDEAVMRPLDAIYSLPSILLLLMVVTSLGSGYVVLVLALAFVYVPRAARVARSAALQFVPREFVAAARARGEKASYVVSRELMPNVLDVLLVEFAMQASWIVLAISSLSFLGLGINPPTPDWGLMVNENRGALSYAPWGTFFPILAIATLVIGLNLASDGLGKALGIDRTREAP